MEQCRELDIAIALSPKGVSSVAAMMRKPGAGQAAQVPKGAWGPGVRRSDRSGSGTDR